MDLHHYLSLMAHSRSRDWTAFSEKPRLASPQQLIAYYLPQFHAIAENDDNWGKGFTEWRNVARALPLFEGHIQPRHPADLGFYDLNRPEVIAQQAALARNYGVNGWALYTYWFDSRKVLQTPLEIIASHPEIDIGYCVFWANENWTRSWDGMESNILLAQRHTPEDDIAFIGEFAQYFSDPRYIRFQGQPVLMMYRPQLLPDARATTDRWRDWCARNGVGVPYLITSDAYGLERPSDHGFDAAAEFPPHRGQAFDASQLRACEHLRRYGPERKLQCLEYASAVQAWSKAPLAGSEKLFKCVFPSWDNSSRRVSSTPTIYAWSEPDMYQQWLRNCLDMAAPSDLVFVNAWNEWAEGAYLEPDLLFGHAYLEATWAARAAAEAKAP